MRATLMTPFSDYGIHHLHGARWRDADPGKLASIICGWAIEKASS
jgi:hypothetical protein